MPALDLNMLLRAEGIDPQGVMVFRHRPTEPKLRKAFRRIIADRRELFDAYQRTHGERVERSLARASHVAAFFGHEPQKAMFVGLYRVAGFTSISRDGYWAMHEHQKLAELGMIGFTKRDQCLLFELEALLNMAEWSGRLVCDWPGKELSWWRWAERNSISVDAISVESLLIEPVPAWDDVVLDWSELKTLPRHWQAAMQQWQAIYYIRDKSTGKGYVGSAYGEDNLLQRWQEYARTGHGGNKWLKGLAPENFEFSVLQLLPVSAVIEEVIAAEQSWKKRLHTLYPDGLNDN